MTGNLKRLIVLILLRFSFFCKEMKRLSGVLGAGFSARPIYSTLAFQFFHIFQAYLSEIVSTLEGNRYQCVGEILPHYRGRPLDLSWTVGLSEKAVGKREQ